MIVAHFFLLSRVLNAGLFYLQHCSFVLGHTDELHGQWKRDANQLWAGEPVPQRRRGEFHRSACSRCVFIIAIFICVFAFLCSLQVTFYVMLAKSRIHLSTKEVSVSVQLKTWVDRRERKQVLVTDRWSLIRMLFLWCRTSVQTIQPVESSAKVLFELDLQLLGSVLIKFTVF